MTRDPRPETRKRARLPAVARSAKAGSWYNPRMPLDRSEVLRIASLARIEITDEEADLLAVDLERIVAYMDGLEKADVPDDATAQTDFESDVHREDRYAECLERTAALRNAPETDGAFFLVPRIIHR